MAKICVVLATYNGAKYLPKMLESLAAQTRPADMIIAIDDGSSDATVKILKSYCGLLPLQITIFAKNQGHRAAFAQGLQLARLQLVAEDFIALADQDDIWLPQKLQTLETVIRVKRANLVYGDAQVIDAEGNVTNDSWRMLSHIQAHVSIEQQIAGINNVTGCLSLFRATLLDRILPIPEGVSVHDRWIAMLAQKLDEKDVIAIPDKVIQYRIHGANAVGGAKTPPMSKTLETQITWAKTILNNANRLNLSPAEITFAKHIIQLSKKRLHRIVAPEELPWIFLHRKDLFLHGTAKQTLKKVLFSAVGLPLARKLWGKS